MKCVLIADIGDKNKDDIVELEPTHGWVGCGAAVPVGEKKKKKPSGVKDGNDS